MHVATVTAGAWGTRLSTCTFQTLNTLRGGHPTNIENVCSFVTPNCGHKLHNIYCSMDESGAARLRFPVSAPNLPVGLKIREDRSLGEPRLIVPRLFQFLYRLEQFVSRLINDQDNR